MAEDDIRAQVAHLYRRAGFGATAAELDQAASQGVEATVAKLMAGLGEPDHGADAVADPLLGAAGAGAVGGAGQDRAARAQLAADRKALALWWLDRMAASTGPLREKLALLWHGHFATGIQKVRLAAYMFRQNQIFRALGAGSFETLTQAVAKDPAMLVWLDSNTNVRSHPNENFARELMELFTLGIGNYTEDDVKEAARCFTGWAVNRSADSFVFRANQHDGGVKTVLGRSGNFGGEDVVTVLTRSPAAARLVPARLWSHLAYPVSATDPVVSELATGYARDLSVDSLVRAILSHRKFMAPQARTGLVKQPVEYVVGAFRALGLKPSEHPEVLAALAGLGQVPFEPPSVGGWLQNGYWLSTAAALTRLRFAALVAGRADLSAIAGAAPAARPAALERLLSVNWTPSTANTLANATDPRLVVALGLVAPEYVLN
ncbi:MAG TPA: DUF1800 domain-containing protein [Acidimicrobiales bacterium]